MRTDFDPENAAMSENTDEGKNYLLGALDELQNQINECHKYLGRLHSYPLYKDSPGDAADFQNLYSSLNRILRKLKALDLINLEAQHEQALSSIRDELTALGIGSGLGEKIR